MNGYILQSIGCQFLALICILRLTTPTITSITTFTTFGQSLGFASFRELCWSDRMKSRDPLALLYFTRVQVYFRISIEAVNAYQCLALPTCSRVPTCQTLLGLHKSCKTPNDTTRMALLCQYQCQKHCLRVGSWVDCSPTTITFTPKLRTERSFQFMTYNDIEIGFTSIYGKYFFRTVIYFSKYKTGAECELSINLSKNSFFKFRNSNPLVKYFLNLETQTEKWKTIECKPMKSLFSHKPLDMNSGPSKSD